MSDVCEKCGTALAEVGAPIWEAYCPNKVCDRDWQNMISGIAASIERTERAEYARLKAKYAASCDTHPKGGDVEQAPFMSGAVPSEAPADAQPQSGTPT